MEFLFRFLFFFYWQELSVALHERLSRGSKKVHILGVDLDPVLVQRAKEKTTTSDSIEFQTVNAMDAELRDQVWRDYLHRHTPNQRFDVHTITSHHILADYLRLIRNIRFYYYFYYYGHFYILKTFFETKSAGWSSGQRCQLAIVETRVRFQPKSKHFRSDQESWTIRCLSFWIKLNFFNLNFFKTPGFRPPYSLFRRDAHDRY